MAKKKEKQDIDSIKKSLEDAENAFNLAQAEYNKTIVNLNKKRLEAPILLFKEIFKDGTLNEAFNYLKNKKLGNYIISIIPPDIFVENLDEYDEIENYSTNNYYLSIYCSDEKIIKYLGSILKGNNIKDYFIYCDQIKILATNSLRNIFKILKISFDKDIFENFEESLNIDLARMLNQRNKICEEFNLVFK